ncbi:MAG: hypothetical protein Fur007_18020 [Rhodoferax sp.]
MQKTFLHALSITALSLSLLACAQPGMHKKSAAGAEPESAGRYSFGLWGDMPYAKAGDAPKLPAVLASLNASDIAFSIYDGDIKDGSSVCTDATFSDALAMFNSLRQPVVYVPGDNEWTDCHRTNNGSMDPLERLTYLRKTMFARTGSLGQKTLPLQHQGQPGQPYVENTRFSYGPVVFAGFNMPGSNNNHIATAKQCSSKSKRTPADCDAAEAEYRARDAANRRWLAETFAQARAQAARGLVLVVQGEPGFDVPETEDVDERQAAGVSGYRAFIDALEAETRRFDGQVLFVHGDMHVFKLDKPFPRPLAPLLNFTRVGTFGSPSLHWVKVTVDPASADVFHVDPVIVQHAK